MFLLRDNHSVLGRFTVYTEASRADSKEFCSLHDERAAVEERGWGVEHAHRTEVSEAPAYVDV